MIDKAKATGYLKFLKDCSVKVSKFSRAHIEPLKMFVRGVADDTTKELMMNYIECSRCGVPTKIVRGLTCGTAMVEFQARPGNF